MFKARKLRKLRDDIRRYVQEQKDRYSWGALDEKIAELEDMGKMESEEDRYANAEAAHALNDICAWVGGDDHAGSDFFSQYLVKRENETRKILDNIRKHAPKDIKKKNELILVRFNVEYEKEVIEVKEYLKEFKAVHFQGAGEPHRIPKEHIRRLARELKDVEETFDRADAAVEGLIEELDGPV